MPRYLHYRIFFTLFQFLYSFYCWSGKAHMYAVKTALREYAQICPIKTALRESFYRTHLGLGGFIRYKN